MLVLVGGLHSPSETYCCQVFIIVPTRMENKKYFFVYLRFKTTNHYQSSPISIWRLSTLLGAFSMCFINDPRGDSLSVCTVWIYCTSPHTQQKTRWNPRTRMLTRMLKEEGNTHWRSCGKPWHDTLIWQSGGTLLLDTIGQNSYSCEPLLLYTLTCDTLTWHFLLDTVVRHSYLTLLQDTLTSHSCRSVDHSCLTLIYDTLYLTRFLWGCCRWLLLDTLSWRSWRALLLDTFVKHFYFFTPVGHSALTRLLDTLAGTLWEDTLTWHSCKALLHDTLSWRSCRTLFYLTLLSDAFTWHAVLPLLEDTLTWHSCGTLLLDTLVEHLCFTLLWQTLTWHWWKLLLDTLVGHS